MTRDIRKNINEEMRIVPENLNCSAYTMATVAAGILFCVGIVIYALLTA